MWKQKNLNIVPWVKTLHEIHYGYATVSKDALNRERRCCLTAEFLLDPLCLSQSLFCCPSPQTSLLPSHSQVVLQTLPQRFSFFNLRPQPGSLALVAWQLKTDSSAHELALKHVSKTMWLHTRAFIFLSKTSYCVYWNSQTLGRKCCLTRW